LPGVRQADEETRAKLKAEHEEQDQHLKAVREQLGTVKRRAAGAAAAHSDDPVDGSPVGPEIRQRHDQGLGEKPAFDFEVKDHVEPA